MYRRTISLRFISLFRIYLSKHVNMNGNHQCNNAMCNQNQIPKNLPLKKRRAYLADSSATNANSGHDENYANYSSTAMRQ